MSFDYQELYEEKCALYRDAKIYTISLRASREISEGGHPTAGFFTSYRRPAEFHNQLRSPFIRPIVCLAATAHKLSNALRGFSLLIVNACLLEFEQAKEEGSKVLPALFGTAYFLASAIVDTLYSIVALITRTLTTGISFILRGGASLTDNRDEDDANTANREGVEVDEARDSPFMPHNTYS